MTLAVPLDRHTESLRELTQVAQQPPTVTEDYCQHEQQAAPKRSECDHPAQLSSNKAKQPLSAAPA